MKLRRNKLQVFMFVIVVLAIIGVISSFISSPSKFIVSIFMMIGVVFVVFMIFSFIVNRRSPQSNDEMKKYRKAVKQSKAKYNKQPTNSHIRKGKASSSHVKGRSEEHTSELQSRGHLVCRLLLEKKK